jgi:hypothetical protein
LNGGNAKKSPEMVLQPREMTFFQNETDQDEVQKPGRETEVASGLSDFRLYAGEFGF